MKLSISLPIGLLLLICASNTFSKTILVPAATDLQEFINSSEAGDILVLADAVYDGNFVIDKPLTLNGQHKAVIDARGLGNAILISADQVIIEQLTIRNWGDDLTETNAGIKAKGGTNLTIRHTQIHGDGFGVFFEGTLDSHIHNNSVQGNASLRSPDRGNGIHLTNVTGVIVEHNQVSDTRDGLYIINSQQNRLSHNRMSNLRFGIHYMYSYNNEVNNNLAEDVDVGYALMSSNNLNIYENRALRCEDYGLLLNFVNTSYFTNNEFDRIRSSREPKVSGDEGKALFVYNSTGNTFTSNRFSNSDMGIHLTAGSEGNRLSRNRFINNEIQVKYVSSREQEWSVDGIGNYWSNYVGWDLNSDDIGDSAFEPNDDVDKLIWKYPEAKVLMDSPAVLLLRWVQRSFPVLKSPGVKDSYPIFRIQEAQLDG